VPRSAANPRCLDHLATTNRLYGAAIRSGIAMARMHGWKRQGPIAPTTLGLRFIASLQPPVKRRVRAPSKIRPGSTLNRDEILRLYHHEHQNIRGMINDCADIDVNRAKFRNPFFPLCRVHVGTGLRINPAHDGRHLWQAEQVKKAEGFPE
jgi:hypothetical protein